MSGDLRDRVLLVLDTESVDAEPERADMLDKALMQIVRKFTGSLQEKVFIKRAYGPHRSVKFLNKLQGTAGWRLGGTGLEEDVVPYVRNDCKAFCLERPDATTLILCFNRPEFIELVGVLDGAGVDVNVVRPTVKQR
ncbi:MAG: hypothetical protein OXI16_13990 [Chloroflexota bacterium]|nr:hypothetical protein [Chloroflexota bacterium]